MTGKDVKLKRHLKSQHELNIGNFLGYDEQPTDCKWKNWQAFLANTTIELIVKDGLKFNKGGWSKKVMPAPNDAIVQPKSVNPITA